MSEKERGMSDPREALVARQREEYGESWDVLVPEVGWTLGRIIESVIEDALSDVTPRGERVKPSVEVLADALAGEGIDALPGEPDLTAMAERLLALLPGRTEAEVKAEALREAASAAVTAEAGIPWDHDHDRATVSAWLDDRAASLARGEGS